MSSKEMAASEAAESPTGDQSRPAQQLEEPAQGDRDDEEVGELSLDVIFEVLKNQRRRYVLRHLKAAEETVSLGDLAEHVAAKENGKTIDAITSDERKRVYVGLYQCHLPKMDDMGIVDFNRDRGLVTLTGVASQLDEYLDDPEQATERVWYRYYGAISVLGLAAIAGVAAGLGPIAAAPTITLGGVIVAFTVVSVAHALNADTDDD